MSHIVVGKCDSKNVSLDLDILLRTRLLVQANSGKGKSWLLRRLAEQLFGKIQVIIIDPEGEFASLREKFGYVLVGKGGETPADPRSAALVAHKLLELRAPAVCDLYEMKPSSRHEWVQRFFEAMIDAPKNLWHPCIIMLDEAHVFCPEKGAGESLASEAVIGMATRGRKRGFCLVAATQRLGKFRKDAAAEMLNVMIGGTFIDIDRKRAADALGVYGTDQHKFFDEIKLLERGSFYSLGPAISDERILVKVGPVESSHPEAGSSKHASEPPPVPEEIAKLLPKLADLPKAAEEKAKTETELRTEIRSLKAQLRSAPAQKVQPTASDPRAIERAVFPLRKLLEEAMKILVKITAVKEGGGELSDEELKSVISAATKELRILAKDKLNAKAVELEQLKRYAAQLIKRIESVTSKESISIEITKVSGAEIQPKEMPSNVMIETRPERGTAITYAQQHPKKFMGDGEVNLKAGARKMLVILAQWHPEQKTRDELGALAGFAASGGTFGEYLSKLRLAGFIHENGNGIAITDEGLMTVGDIPNRPDSTEALVGMWKSKFKAGVGRMLDVLVTHYPQAIPREVLGEESGFTSSGGTFGEYLSQLRRARLIEESGGHVRAAESLFP